MLSYPGEVVQGELLQRDAVFLVLDRLCILHVTRRVDTLDARLWRRRLQALTRLTSIASERLQIRELGNVVRLEPVAGRSRDALAIRAEAVRVRRATAEE